MTIQLVDEIGGACLEIVGTYFSQEFVIYLLCSIFDRVWEVCV